MGNYAPTSRVRVWDWSSSGRTRHGTPCKPIREVSFLYICTVRGSLMEPRYETFCPVKHVTVLNENAQTHARHSNVRGGQMSASTIDVSGLERDLRASIRGEVRFDEGSRALYTSDASNYRQVPIGVVLPRDADDVVETMKVCRRYGAPVLARGGGTSLAGQCCNVAVVIDMSKYMNGILELNAQERWARIQPGII